MQQSNIEGLLSRMHKLSLVASGEVQCPCRFCIKDDSISELLQNVIFVSLSNECNLSYVVPRTVDT